MDHSGDEGNSDQQDSMKELLKKVKQEDGALDFGRFKKLYTTKQFNEELRSKKKDMTRKGVQSVMLEMEDDYDFGGKSSI